MFSFPGGTPGARLMFVHPGVEIKSVEGDAGAADRNLDKARPDIALEDRRANTQIGRRLSGPKQAGQEDRQHITSTDGFWRPNAGREACLSLRLVASMLVHTY